MNLYQQIFLDSLGAPKRVPLQKCTPCRWIVFGPPPIDYIWIQHGPSPVIGFSNDKVAKEIVMIFLTKEEMNSYNELGSLKRENKS